MDIIDIHTHASLAVDTIDAGLALGVHNGIRRFVLLGDVLGKGSSPNEEDIRAINDHTSALAKRYAEVRWFCFLNPRHNESFINTEIERTKGLGAIGVKLEISALASDECLIPIMKALERYTMPLLHHAWNTQVMGKNPSPGTFQTDPDDVAVLARRHPNVIIIAAHLRGIMIRGVAALRDHPNVCIDTSGGQPTAEILEYAVNSIGSERILFGSDAYFPAGRDFAVQIAAVDAAHIGSREKENIFRRNAERILKVTL